MKNNITITKMTMPDFNKIAPILEIEFDDFWNANILKAELQNKNSIYLVCKLGNEIVGFAGVTIILDIAEINNIVIKKAFRGKGLSKILFQKLLKECKKHNCNKINLEVCCNNNIAINLYKKFGFKQVGVRKNYYKKQDGSLFTKFY